MTLHGRLKVYNQVMGQVPEFDRLTHRLVSILGSLPSTSRVLEVGSGTGLLTQALLNLSALKELVCVDPDEEACRILAQAEWAKHGRVTAIIPRALEESELKGGFDAIISRFVIHHIPDEHKHLITRTMRKLLRHGGTLVIGDMVLSHYGSEVSRPRAVERYYASTLQIARRLGNQLLIADQQQCFRSDMLREGEYKICRCRMEMAIEGAGFQGLRRFRIPRQGGAGWPGLICVSSTKI
jgi:2-polyprenyl-3-methyl-5-hydroxy-6-metoxy-1,4-benzoquinol methylase